MKSNSAQILCAKHSSVYLHLLHFPEKTSWGLRSITCSSLEKIVLISNWNYLGSWSLGTEVVQMQDLLLRGQENLLRHRSEWSPVGVPPGKTKSGMFYYKLLLSNIPYIQFLLFLSFFCHDCLVGLFYFVYLHLLEPWMYYFENSSWFGGSWALQFTYHQLTISHLVSLAWSLRMIVLLDRRISLREASGLDLKISRDRESRTSTGCLVAKHPQCNPINLPSAFSSLIFLSLQFTEASCL